PRIRTRQEGMMRAAHEPRAAGVAARFPTRRFSGQPGGDMETDSRDLRSKLKTLLDKASGASTRLGHRPGPVTRRDFLQLGAVAGAGASLSGTASQAAGQAEGSRAPGESQ